MTSSDARPCSQWELMLHGFVDGELDAIHSLQLEHHLRTCPQCADQLERLKAVKEVVGQKGVRWRAPDHVRAQVLAAISREAAIPATSADTTARRQSRQPFNLLGFIRQWMFIPSLAALAASLFLVITPIHNRSSIEDDVVAGHVRSLLANHLTDVATSDQHTVKPWFNGKLDFSPAVKDVDGFPLLGGRLDYLNGHPAAALIYGRRNHIINVFTWPSAAKEEFAGTRNGYHAESWYSDGMTFWAVSDLNDGELRDFIKLFRRN